MISSFKTKDDILLSIAFKIGHHFTSFHDSTEEGMPVFLKKK